MSAKGARDRTFRFVISLDLFLAVQCCCLRNFPERNRHLTHTRVSPHGGGGGHPPADWIARIPSKEDLRVPGKRTSPVRAVGPQEAIGLSVRSIDRSALCWRHRLRAIPSTDD